MPISDCCESTGRAMGEIVFRFISRGSLIPTMIIFVIVGIVLTGVLADQTGSQMKELEINTFTSCKIRTITSMLEPTPQNLTDVIGMAPCYFNKKHPSEVMPGAAPEISPAAIAFCVFLWVSVFMFSMALIYGRD